MPKVRKKKKLNIVVKAESVNEDLGLVFGWAVVSTIKGKKYFDLDNEHIPLDVIIKAVMKAPGRIEARDMHGLKKEGDLVFALPVLNKGDIMSKSGKTGLYIVNHYDNKEIIKQFMRGERTAYSIGGVGVTVPVAT